MRDLPSPINHFLLNKGFVGTTEEKEIIKVKKNLNKIISRLNPNSKKEDWDKFYSQKKNFEEKINGYSGEYLEYFNSKLREVNFEEKWAWGYCL